MRKLIIMLIVGLVVTLIPISALAGYVIVGSNTDLRTRLEVSKDGATWYNYLAETNSGNQTLEVNAGDTVTFRLKMWDVGETAAHDIILGALITNPQYIQTANIFDDSAVSDRDLDGDSLVYTTTGVDSTAGTASLIHDQVNTGTVEEGTTNNEGGTFTTTISSSTPDQTLIQVTMTITGGTAGGRFVGIRLLDRAYADDQATTIVRILVHNPTTAPAAQTALPSTGQNPQDIPNDKIAILIGSVLVGVVASYSLLRSRRNRSKSKV